MSIELFLAVMLPVAGAELPEHCARRRPFRHNFEFQGEAE
jgi:hypothetical protein